MEPGNGTGHGEAARAALLALDMDAARSHLRQAMEMNAAASISRGQSLNPSQHQTGQLIDEFALDRHALAELQAAKQLAPAARIAALKDIVRRYPDNTAAATMLLLDLQRAGLLKAGERDAASPVPQRIAQFWDRPDPPADIRRLMASWNGEAGFDYHLFDERTAETFLRRNAGRDAARAFRRAGHAAQRADLFRLAWLAKEGGIYADADDRRIAPFDDLVPGGAEFVAYQENYGSIANNFLAAVPGHPVVTRALDLATTALNRGDRDFVWLSTGPGLMTRAMAQVLAETDDPIGGVLVRELHEMRPLAEIHCPADYKSTRAHWSRAVFARLRPRTTRSKKPTPDGDSAA
jgi:mannosyltransferase OCH1-like enzyme